MAYPQYVLEREQILKLLDAGKTIEFIIRKKYLNLEYREVMTLVKKSPPKVRILYYRNGENGENGELLLDNVETLDEHKIGNLLCSGVEWRVLD